ncbi:hypothetical protein GH714_020864 [Hevea brasiliensis]|uniref:PH domain-containing protein n=1 Tax=Hevea brasiliensis TaxID=3981 RepID=A0A6A6KRU0_HEVBR|nr:hypothetical protein GH714_020864 [Hevea brasiliensis]
MMNGAPVSDRRGRWRFGKYPHMEWQILLAMALIALKKGAQLLKYGRKGKPKFCPFRLSNDETTLIWISSSGERSLKLASVSKIIPGQRTAVFQRYLRPEKDYLSFSLIYNNGKRSLDLICKDKVEAEVWIAGLKALISSGQGGRSKIDGWSDGGLYLDVMPPILIQCFNPSTSPRSFRPENSPNSDRSHVASDNTNMQVKGSGSDAFRVSVSSAPSTSSHGSAPDDCDALGDVYIWGEVIYDNTVKPERFGEHQAETWWSENREKVYEKYNVRGSDKSSVSSQAARRSEGAMSSSSQS